MTAVLRGVRINRRLLGPTIVVVALVAAACTSGSGSQVSEESEVKDYTEEALAFADAASDASFPDGVAPDTAVGTYGHSRYVWTQGPDGIYPTLIEGPRGQQVRCEDEDLPCSYQDLKALHESGDPIPKALAMSRAELGELVGQLDTLNAKLAAFDGPDGVCADGYERQSTQNPNMGIHMVRGTGLADGFVVDEPEMILLAMEGGESLRQSELGECVDGRWTGDSAMQVVGAVYMMGLTNDHPEGFAGKLDNWHVHFNTCAGGDSELRAVADPAACEAEGGSFQEKMPIWMMHAYTAPGFDSQLGVFAMFNESIWPLGGGGDRLGVLDADLGEGTVLATIDNFDFGKIKIDAGEKVVFANSDGVPHTVTSGTPGAPTGDFDSGLFGSGEVYSRTFDEPGKYKIYCSLHPQMTTTVVVRG